ncbi:MAG: tetratricopeptide repeat protein, partial [Acidobacteriota bacterium]|nr:tetratricopeptide repeat protein [Acidobacteriota bacterium]
MAVHSAGASQENSAQNPGQILKQQFDTAKAFLASNDTAQADLAYRRTIAIGLRQLGNLSLSQAQYEDATRYLDEALNQTPNDPGLQVEAAIAWFRRGNIKKAKEQIAAVLAKEPDHARAHNVLGRIYLFEGNPTASIEELKAAVAQQADFETAYFMAIAYLKAKKVSDAAELFSELQASTGDSAALHVLFGRAYIVTHFPEPAVAEFRKAIALDPKYPRAHSLLGYAYLDHLNEQGYPLAQALFQQELKIQPDDYLTLVLLGLTDVSLRDYAAAETVLRHAIRVRPDGAAPFLYLGEAYTSTQRIKQAVSALEKYVALVHNPEEFHRDLGRGYFLLGQGLLRLGRAEEAKKALARSQQLREAEFKYDQEHMFFDQEHQIEAKETSDGGESHASDRIAGFLESGTAGEQDTQAMAQGGMPNASALPATAVNQPKEPAAAHQYRVFAAEVLSSAYNDLGVMQAKNSKFAEASELFKQAATWNPRLPGLDRNWGFASFRAEQYSDAVPPLQRDLAAHSDDAFVRQLLGLSYFFQDKYPKTVEVLQPLIKNPPDDPGLLFAWGTALVRTRQSEAAADIFRRLLSANAGNPSVHFLLGQAYAQQEDYPNALSEFKTAFQMDPHLPEAHYYTGLVYLRQSQFELAAQEFRSELELQPGNPITEYHLGYALLVQGQLDQAVPMLRQVVQAKPDYEPAQFELGSALLKQGDANGAVQSLEIATKLTPDHDAAFFQLSQAYRRAGRIPEAGEALAKYQKLIEKNRLKKRETLE